MKSTTLGRLMLYVCGGFAMFALCGQPAHGGIVTATLTCVLDNPTSPSCSPSNNYGTVKLDDGVVAGSIFLTVDVQGVAGKFRDLMLNFNGAGITTVSSGDGQALLSPDGLGFTPDGFNIPPYQGKFDIGSTGQQGWNTTSALYTTLLTGNGSLTLGMFDVLDSLGNLNVALHLQDLATGGSIKVGGLWEGGGEPPAEIPEPATAALLGGGLIALAWTLRRRKAS